MGHLGFFCLQKQAQARRLSRQHILCAQHSPGCLHPQDPQQAEGTFLTVPLLTVSRADPAAGLPLSPVHLQQHAGLPQTALGACKWKSALHLDFWGKKW